MRTAIFVFILLLNSRVGLTKRRVTKETHEIMWDPSVTDKLAYGEIYHIDVKINEYMDIYCPQYDADAVKVLEFVIFNVSVDAFNECYLPEKPQEIFVCNTPSTTRKLTTKFQKQSPNPLGFVFKPGSQYYYIAFTDMEKQGCENAMRMKINVNHRSISHHTKAPTNLTPSQPGNKPHISPTVSTKGKHHTTTTTTLKSIVTRAVTSKKDQQAVGSPSTGGSGTGGNASSLRFSPVLTFLLLLLVTILRT